VAYALSDKTKIIDLGRPQRSVTTSTVGYSSDSWASCFIKPPHCVKTLRAFSHKLCPIFWPTRCDWCTGYSELCCDFTIF